MFWNRLKSMWGKRNDRLAVQELRRESAAAEGPGVPHTGGALFDEALQPQPVDEVPGDDLQR